MFPIFRVVVAVLIVAPTISRGVEPPSLWKTKPRMADFMGVNGHYYFRPALYRPVSSLVRNYHPVTWDMPGATSRLPDFPLSRQTIAGAQVDWAQLYGSWRADGYTIDASLQFDFVKPAAWVDLSRDAEAYGRAFASAFGPSSSRRLVESAEIGNEPANYDDRTYRRLFEAAAKGMRSGDPQLKIVTAAAAAVNADQYSRSVECFRGLEAIYDVINIHTYSMVEGWPTWRRVYPEHPAIPYLKVVREMASWRDRNAPDKEIWITEFGYDASTKPAPTTGDYAKWVSSTETEQAQWLVRSYLLFAALPISRAYAFYYNDEDGAALHASSGITRNFEPKPAYWALAHLRLTLGDYRFSRVICERPGELFVYEFSSSEKPKQPIWVAWSPTGRQREAQVTIPIPGAIARVDKMPLNEGLAATVPFKLVDSGVQLQVGESPVYLRLRLP